MAEAELPRGLLSYKPNGEEESPKVRAAQQGQLTEPKRQMQWLKGRSTAAGRVCTGEDVGGNCGGFLSLSGKVQLL